jgi:hypothetical protein
MVRLLVIAQWLCSAVEGVSTYHTGRFDVSDAAEEAAILGALGWRRRRGTGAGAGAEVRRGRAKEGKLHTVQKKARNDKIRELGVGMLSPSD